MKEPPTKKEEKALQWEIRFFGGGSDGTASGSKIGARPFFKKQKIALLNIAVEVC